MIMSSLCGKGPLSPEVTGAAFKALACKPCQGGLDPPLLCALAVAQVRFSVLRHKRQCTPRNCCDLAGQKVVGVPFCYCHIVVLR